MAKTLPDLVELMDLERLEVDLFRGRQPETSWQRVFGGQVAGQSLVAAGRTVEADRPVHSLHGYFVRPGDPAVPIVYAVDRIRDGRSFSTRRVVATQHGRAIFTMSASFQVTEAGFTHQDPMPVSPDPQTLPTTAERAAYDPEIPPWWREFAAIDVRQTEAEPVSAGALASGSRIWLRGDGRLPDDPLLHAAFLVYASDLTLLRVSLLPHLGTGERPSVQMASLDHAMWFHRPFRADDWLLYDQASPSASGARGLSTGRIFAADGDLVASVVQEGLIRPGR